MANNASDLNDAAIGRRIRIHRKAAKMSQTALADGIGVSFQQVQKYESGANRTGPGQLMKIASVLNVPVSKFFSEKNIARRAGRGTGSPLDLLENSGARRLLRAYGKIENAATRRSIVNLIEKLVMQPGTAPREEILGNLKESVKHAAETSM